MIASIVTIPDGFTIKFSNGWEISDRELAVVAVALIAMFAAVAIWGIVRLVNRHQSATVVKPLVRKPDPPSEAN
jgi:hypothetical protein